MIRSLSGASAVCRTLLILVFAGLVLTGCGTMQTSMLNSEPPMPIAPDAAMALPPIEVSNVISSIPMDQEIGHGHQGLVNIRNDTYLAGSKISEAHLLIMTSLEEELVATGYKLINSKSTIFNTSKDEGSGVKLQIGGEILDCKFDSYEAIGKKKSKASASVTWSLFDPQQDKVVYSMESSGEAEGPAKSVSSLAYAVRASFRVFLDDAGFLDSLKAASNQ